jgi:hypothetical protein
MSTLGGAPPAAASVAAAPVAVAKAAAPGEAVPPKVVLLDAAASSVSDGGSGAAAKKKKKKKNKKKKGAAGGAKATITLTRWNKESKSHVQVTRPLVSTERESSGTEDEDESDEGLLGYRKGGYHPVNLDESYGQRYRVLHKLGWGQFSTVWLCWDKQADRHVALKFVKSASHYMEAARDEIEIMEVR